MGQVPASIGDRGHCAVRSRREWSISENSPDRSRPVMPICEADPWRFQYFDGIPCPEDVRISTEDPDSWIWFPDHRWIYDKLAVALSQGLQAAPHGVMPPSFPVFSKPIMNLRGMGTGSRVIQSETEYKAALTAGHFWCTL